MAGYETVSKYMTDCVFSHLNQLTAKFFYMEIKLKICLIFLMK
jgi:hypothetical protein